MIARKHVKPEELDVELVALAIDWAPQGWEGHCYEVAKAIERAQLVEGHAVYGHYLGPISAGSYWGVRRSLPFVRHGWLVLKDGRILDPTRWSFENVAPYLWLGPGDCQDYDEGGDRWRQEMHASRPPPDVRGDDERLLLPIPLRVGDGLRLRLRSWVHLLLGGKTVTTREGLRVTFRQMGYLANLPYATLQPHALEVYEAIVAAGHEALIPVDNLLRARRKGGKPG